MRLPHQGDPPDRGQEGCAGERARRDPQRVGAARDQHAGPAQHLVHPVAHARRPHVPHVLLRRRDQPQRLLGAARGPRPRRGRARLKLPLAGATYAGNAAGSFARRSRSRSSRRPHAESMSLPREEAWTVGSVRSAPRARRCSPFGHGPSLRCRRCGADGRGRAGDGLGSRRQRARRLPTLQSPASARPTPASTSWTWVAVR